MPYAGADDVDVVDAVDQRWTSHPWQPYSRHSVHSGYCTKRTHIKLFWTKRTFPKQRTSTMCTKSPFCRTLSLTVYKFLNSECLFFIRLLKERFGTMAQSPPHTIPCTTDHSRVDGDINIYIYVNWKSGHIIQFSKIFQNKIIHCDNIPTETRRIVRMILFWIFFSRIK